MESGRLVLFEELILAHLDAAHNLARWLVRNAHDAEDLVQESCLRAFKFFDGLHATDGRAWFLTIVRNTCYTWLERNRHQHLMAAFDEEVHSIEDSAGTPEAILLERADAHSVHDALESLPPEFREVIILRELEGLSYKEIAEVAALPVGTVMSRLARARQRLQECLASPARREP